MLIPKSSKVFWLSKGYLRASFLILTEKNIGYLLRIERYEHWYLLFNNHIMKNIYHFLICTIFLSLIIRPLMKNFPLNLNFTFLLLIKRCCNPTGKHKRFCLVTNFCSHWALSCFFRQIVFDMRMVYNKIICSLRVSRPKSLHIIY